MKIVNYILEEERSLFELSLGSINIKQNNICITDII